MDVAINHTRLGPWYCAFYFLGMGVGCIAVRHMFQALNSANVFWLSSDAAKRSFLRKTGFSFVSLWAARRIHIE